MVSNTGIILGSYTLQTTLGGPINDAWAERHFDVQLKENVSENARSKNYGTFAIFSIKTVKW